MNFPEVGAHWLSLFVAVAFAGIAGDAQALTPAQTRAKVAALKKRLFALPDRRAPFSIILSLTTKLAQSSPGESSGYLVKAMRKISISNAKKNAAALTRAVNAQVGISNLGAAKKRAIVNRNKTLLKKYVPPSFDPGIYQAMRREPRPVG